MCDVDDIYDSVAVMLMYTSGLVLLLHVILSSVDCCVLYAGCVDVGIVVMSALPLVVLVCV